MRIRHLRNSRDRNPHGALGAKMDPYSRLLAAGDEVGESGHGVMAALVELAGLINSNNARAQALVDVLAEEV
jgi:hypothetical protein